MVINLVADRQTDRNRKRQRERDRETETQTERDRQTETETNRQRDRDNDTDRETPTDRQTDRQRASSFICHKAHGVVKHKYSNYNIPYLSAERKGVDSLLLCYFKESS